MNNLKKEDGYVLVVIIGILTILSLMTITFATLSRIETRATRNYTDSIKCEKIAMAGLEHAIYVLRLDKFGTDTIAYNDDSGDENYDWSGETWMPGNVDLTNPITSFAGTNTSHYDNDGDSVPDSKWIYFPVTATTGTNTTAIRLPGKLLARYAVLITDDRAARININATGNRAGGGNFHTSNEGWSTFEIDLSDLIEREVGNGITIANLIIDARHGADSNPGNAGNDDPGKIPDPQNDGIDNDGDLIVDEFEEEKNEPNEFNSIFPYGDDEPFGLLSEAEIMGTSSYESRLEEQFTTGGITPVAQGAFKGYLTTYSADTIVCPPYTLDGYTSTTKLNINALVNNEGAYTDTGTYDSDKKVKMLRDVLEAGGITGAVGSDGYKERHQLAVNIKDFIDSDGTSTTYIDVIPDPDETYYGVDNGTPYINEVEAWPSGTNPEFIELYNPYDEDLPTAGGWTIRVDAGETIIAALPAASVPAGGYYVIGASAAAGVDQIETAIANLDPNGEELRLRDNNGIDVQITFYGSANENDTRSLNDPRPIPLTATPSDPWSWTTTPNTIRAQNDNFNPTGIGDNWTLATYSSSFFIANRRFSNIGYLGFIHKGSEWSSFDIRNTINYPDVLQFITITDPSMDKVDNDGDGDVDTYDTNGDGDIDANDTGDTSFQTGDFDGKEYRIPGLINVNTAPTEVLASLPDGSGGTLGNIIAAEISGGSKPYESIGDLIDKVDGVNGITDITATNKWDEEKRFRAISNLITTRSNVFTVYVTAQVTEEDVSDPPNTQVFAEKRIMAIIDRSVDPIKVRYFRWITE